MSDILTNFADAILTKFNALVDGNHNAFWTLVNGQLYDGEASALADFPYSVFTIVSHVPDKTFTEDHRNLLIQFSHFSETKAEAKAIAAACNDLFDECEAFAITNATLSGMHFDNGQDAMPEDVGITASGATRIWHLPNDYEALVELT